MTRPGLRSRSGCLPCKKRRKKCDEARPICGACSRWNKPCLWPEDREAPAAERVSANMLMNVKWPLMGHGCTRFQSQAELTLLRAFGGIYQSFFCPMAGPEFVNLSAVVTVCLDQAWTRDALNAFTAYMMFIRSGDRRLERLALMMYQSVIGSMREALNRPLREHETAPIILAATFLGLLEGIGTGSPTHVSAHFSLVARLGQSGFFNPFWNASLLPLKRMVLECLVYNLASVSILHPVSTTVYNAIDWVEYDRLFNSCGPNQMPYQLSPHFGGNGEFYQLILEVTHIGRQTLDQRSRAHYADTWLSRIDFLERRLATYYQGVPERTADMYIAKYQLHAAALRIYAMKIRDHLLLASAPEITHHVHQAARIFSNNMLQESHNPSLAWPLTVFLCACADPTTFIFFAKQIEQIKQNFGRGHSHNLELVQDNIRLSFEPIYGRLSSDNLRLLLLKDGLLSAERKGAGKLLTL